MRTSVVRLAAVFILAGLVAAGPRHPTLSAWGADGEVPKTSTTPSSSGLLTFVFDPLALDVLGWQLASTGELERGDDGLRLVFALQPSAGAVATGKAVFKARMRGGLLLVTESRRLGLGALEIRGRTDGRWNVVRTGTDRGDVAVFEIQAESVEVYAASGDVRVSGELAVSSDWASLADQADVAGMIVGRLSLDSRVDDGTDEAASAPRSLATADANSSPERAEATGPDVIVGDLHEANSYGSEGDISAFAVGTTSCNIGNRPLNWFELTSEHPVIGQNMYRLKDGRFEHIGQSWLKHGFFALSDTLCSGPAGCDGDDNGEHLGVGCSDPYSANLNGLTFVLGPRSQVNAFTGQFPYPFSAPQPQGNLARRLQVYNDDLDPGLNPGALYFVEGHYVNRDDAAFGNRDNNASYRRATLSFADGKYILDVTGETQRTRSGIRAWKDHDPAVRESFVRVPAEGLMMLAAKVTSLPGGLWHYEYALQNLNSDRACGSFSVPVHPLADVVNVAFHDVNYHSGEPYSLDDWPGVASGGTVSFSTEPFSVNANANALRWGTLYNFRFDANVPPVETNVTVGLFKPGTPSSVDVVTVGPTSVPTDCNANGVDDLCDLSCGGPGGSCDVPGCGQSADCSGNGVPDECEPDCNGNQVADSCDILAAPATDCDGNGVPDECEWTDCNDNGALDRCDLATGTSLDCDGGPIGSRPNGEALFAISCAQCHGTFGSGGIDPPLQNRSRVEIKAALLPPTIHPGGSFANLMEQDFADLEVFVTAVSSRGRPDGIPDDCQGLSDCDADGTSDGCQLEAGSAQDLDFNGLPDACERVVAPVADPIARNRYLSFVPGGAPITGAPGAVQALRVASTAGGTSLPKWVDTPDENSIARLSCVPVYRDWGTQLLNVADADIVPDAQYVVQGILEGAETTQEFLYSAPPTLIATAGRWGDVAGNVDPESGAWGGPNDVINVNDVVAALHRIMDRSNAPPISWVDLDPEVPNKLANVTDVQLILLAWRGRPYPFGPGTSCD